MKTKAQKKNLRTDSAGRAELVFVVDVSAFTETGFLGSSTYDCGKVDIAFDGNGEGLFLTPGMAERLQVSRGSSVSLLIESDSTNVFDLKVAGLREAPRISDPRAYFSVGREGGAILRLRRT